MRRFFGKKNLPQKRRIFFSYSSNLQYEIYNK